MSTLIVIKRSSAIKKYCSGTIQKDQKKKQKRKIDEMIKADIKKVILIYLSVVLIASAKSWSMRGASQQPAFRSGCLTISHTYLPCLPRERTLLY